MGHQGRQTREGAGEGLKTLQRTFAGKAWPSAQKGVANTQHFSHMDRRPVGLPAPNPTIGAVSTRVESSPFLVCRIFSGEPDPLRLKML
jgi:hypothetical protein